MEKRPEQRTLVSNPSPTQTLWKGLGWGSLGGFAGTLVMDFLLMTIFWALGEPPTLCFSIVGDTVASFAALFHAVLASGVPAGVITHYVVGPLFGLIFGGFVMRLPPLRNSSVMKSMLAALVYVEILSLPILATTPLLLKMDALTTLEWFGGSFIMHFILSIVLGWIVAFGQQQQRMSAGEQGHVRL